MVSFLRENLVWFLLSLLLSLGLWIVVTFQKDPEVTNTIANVPVEVQNPPSAVLVQAEASTVQVVVSAPNDVWPQLKQDKFRAILDASKVTPGGQELPVKIVSGDPRARIVSFDPDRITVRVDPLRTKSVPVEVIHQGTVGFQYDLGTLKTTPTEVAVSGPQSRVDQVSAAVVELNLDGVTKTIDQPYKPIPESAGGANVDGVTVTPEQVLVELPVELKLGYKTLPVQVKLTGTVALGYQVVGITADPETVTLVGDPKTLNQLQVASTQLINVQDATSDREIQTDLALPGTVALATAQTIDVRVQIQAVDGTKTILVSPRVTNAAAGVVYAVTPGAVNVTLSGPIPVLSRVGADEVPVVADAKGIVTGTVTVTAQVTVPPLVKLEGIQPPNLVIAVK